MWGCQCADFQGLLRVRNICICLRLLLADLAAVRLAPWRSAVAGAPGMNRDPAPGGARAPARSSRVRGAIQFPGAGGRGGRLHAVAVTRIESFYGAAALMDEADHLQKCLVARQKSLLCGKDFGGQRAIASLLAWRLAACGSLLECCEPSVHPAEQLVRELRSRGQATLAMMLDRTGALRLRWRSRARGVHSPRPSRLRGPRCWQGEPKSAVQLALDLMLCDCGRVHCGTARQWFMLPHAAFADREAAVKPERVLLLPQELDQWPAPERPGLGTAALREIPCSSTASDFAASGCAATRSDSWLAGSAHFPPLPRDRRPVPV
jgi:hypothetical protein